MMWALATRGFGYQTCSWSPWWGCAQDTCNAGNRLKVWIGLGYKYAICIIVYTFMCACVVFVNRFPPFMSIPKIGLFVVYSFGGSRAPKMSVAKVTVTWLLNNNHHHDHHKSTGSSRSSTTTSLIKACWPVLFIMGVAPRFIDPKK